MDRFNDQIASVIDALDFERDYRYFWFRTPGQAIDSGVKEIASAVTVRDYFVNAVTNDLYRWFYCLGHASPYNRGTTIVAENFLNGFAERLELANRGQGRRDEGWRVVRCGKDESELLKDGMRLFIDHENPLLRTCMGDLGETVSIPVASGSNQVSPGYYMAFGDLDILGTSQDIVRVYWNVDMLGAVSLINSATELLNSEKIPFRLKALNDPNNFFRTDAAVLYIPKALYPVALPHLRKIHTDIEGYLRPGIPALTKALATGVALAEEPNDGGSYGRHRCSIIASCLCNAHEQGLSGKQAKYAAVKRGFELRRLDIRKPYLNGASRDSEYEAFLPVGKDEFARQRGKVSNRRDRKVSGEKMLETALQIGLSISKDAIWHDGKCNWFGASNRSTSRGIVTDYGSLNGSLYSGTAGIGLFLSELDFEIEESIPVLRVTIDGAMKHAMTETDRMFESKRLGAYDGAAGVALAASWIGAKYRDEAYLEAAEGILKRIARNTTDILDFDVVSGRAGAILALLVCRQQHTLLELDDALIKMGRELIASGEKTKNGLSWSGPDLPAHHNLTGYSHGASGAAHALLELDSFFPGERFREAAEQAIAYESACYDPDHENWPDYRMFLNTDAGAEERNLSFLCYWCHGASGIALARMRAYQLLQADTYLNDAKKALSTTYRACDDELLSGSGNFSLCHGLCGNAEVLKLAHQWSIHLLDENADAVWTRVASQGVATFSQTERPWPLGVGGDTPGLLVGRAGIGHFYLSLWSSKIPSTLFLCPDQWSYPAAVSTNPDTAQR